MPKPNLKLFSIQTLPINLSLHSCRVQDFVLTKIVGPHSVSENSGVRHYKQKNTETQTHKKFDRLWARLQDMLYYMFIFKYEILPFLFYDAAMRQRSELQ